MSGDPLMVLWSALEAHGCRPRGPRHNFRSRCPGHDGENPSSLHVQVGADGRCVLFCHAHGCTVEEITAAIGLSVSDLFPDGHRYARRHSLRAVKRTDFHGAARSVANVLYALEQLAEPWQVMVCSRCPSCGSPGGWVRAHSAGTVLANNYISQGGFDADCPEGCDKDQILQGLLGQLHNKEAA